MPIPESFPFTRYLAAKKALDDRSLNRHVFGALARRLVQQPAGQQPVQVLEIGAGIGTMLARLLEWGQFGRVDYTALDSNPENIAAARGWLAEWAAQWGFACLAAEDGALVLRRGLQHVHLRLQAENLFAVLDRAGGEASARRYDLIIAHAFLDLVDLERTLPRLLGLLRPEGLFYFSLNFDGATIFEPPIDPALDAHIEQSYHQTMDERVIDGRPSGDSRTGRRLFHHLQRLGAQVIAAGSSDWVVHPHQGGYTPDEHFFLHFILHTLEQGLAGRPGLDPARFAAWIAGRQAQVERGELVYIAHQLDLLGQVGG